MMGKTLSTIGSGFALAAACLTATLPLSSGAQGNQGLGDMIFTAGTVTTDDNGREWAYLSWMATDLNMLLGVQYDIYAKDGDFSSANPYQLKGTAQLQTDPKSITILNVRAENLGQDLTDLETAIDELFAEAVPAGDLTLGEKVAAVIDGSLEDTEMFQNIVFMSQAHPALTLALGRGFACQINNIGITSFEIRDHNTGEVIGRVSVEAGYPTILPAPENMVQVTNDTPKGHLNIRLRWESPPELRRLALMQFGYSLYRMPYKYTIIEGYDVTPPAPELLRELAESDPSVKKVNILPILPNEDEVTPETYFFIDDNDGLSGGTPFVDGERVFYFVTALDLLGRDGEVSQAFEAVACDRVAPRVPKDIRTRALYTYNESSNQVQSVEISWDQDPDAAETHAYFVYRYDTISNMQANAENEVYGRIAGPIDRINGADRLAYTNELSAADQDRTFWYTVRSVDDAYCGTNMSLNSAPIHGGIHDWEGPEDQLESFVNVYVQTLDCFVKNIEVANLGADINFELICERFGSGVEWVEFAYIAGEAGKNEITNAVHLGRYDFLQAATVIQQYDLPVGLDQEFTIFCRVGNGMKASEWATAYDRTSGDMRITFNGEANYGYVPSTSGDGPHITGTIIPYFPLLEVKVPTGAGEYRFYRRVNNGPRSLIGQGETTNALTIIEADEQAFIANGGTICYYYQFFDFNGNPGPMTLIDCVPVARAMDLPVPVLNPLESIGTEISNPGFEASWFCAPQGVERFEVAVHKDGGNTLTATFSSDLRDIENNGITNFTGVVLDGVVTNLDFMTYMTGRVGANFGIPDHPEFLISTGTELGIEHIIMVRAVGPNGERGGWSEARKFIWVPAPLEGPNVPWPSRPVPPVANAFNPKIFARLMKPLEGKGPGEVYEGLYDAYSRVGVRIGEIDNLDMGDINGSNIWFNTLAPPEDFLYEDEDGRTMLSCALYRYQIPSNRYPQVGGDVAQVSVMMENIAYGTNDPQQPGKITIYDPFIRVAKRSVESKWGIYLLDTHPVMRGATYQYLLVRFEENGEVDTIFKVGTLAIPK